jgi:structural maintenance of chromosome 2
LKEKKTQLIRDKKKLEQFIEELDIKKREVLETCWKQVNESFSEIFSNLLPNCSAQLCLTSTNKIEDGLEMQVRIKNLESHLK